jgi:hypothetical protein
MKKIRSDLRHHCQGFSAQSCDRAHAPWRKSRESRDSKKSLKLAPDLLVLRGMSFLRTMSLIVGGALVALGGTAVALFL